MKKTFLIIILTLNSFLFYSQVDSTKVAFVSYWSIGDSYDFKVSKINQQWNEDKLVKDQKQEYIANFTVIDSTETSYTVKWSYKNDLGNTYKIPQELLEKFSKYELTEILYKTSEVGDLLEILNWKEISLTMENMFDDIINVLGKNDENLTNTLKKSMEPLKNIYSTKQGIEELVLKELQYFHFPMGVEFDITEPLYYDEELPNMFGGDPIKGKVKITFENVDFEESFCTLKQEMNLNPEDTKELLRQVFVKMNIDSTKMTEMLKTAVFEIKDDNTYEYYFNPGVPHKIKTVRETTSHIDNSQSKRIDTMIIELIYND
ncbi:hypothetical protein ACS386_09215 [Flavobacteriaceae bacterium LMO-SS05]